MSRVAELEAKRAALQAAKAEAEEAQYEKDLEARIALEEEHGTIAAVKVSRFVPGQPTHAYLRTPNANEYKRFKAQIFAAQAGKKGGVTPSVATEMLAESCWLYPAEKEARDAMLEVFPGLLSPISAAAVALAQGTEEAEGKD
ncbi:MAG: hypothetical protein A3E78_14485 [Alphaproteobacteria bacterium RIFCSPHIGHO2_12_FULL_63_12]|nr:MAG: hypothetical protein A3E78_14485 [Alphaproteobacteria bacterium RIFCSPHIGHO2_12_FULL_63_12]